MLTLGSGTIQIAAYVAGVNPASIATSYPSPITIGEVGGDIEFDISFQDKDFFGQSVFALARGFYGGKVAIRAKKVELYPANLAALTNIVQSSGGGNDIWSVTNASKPVPVYVKFVHARSDATGKVVNVHLFKAYSVQLAFPFSREDIGTQDWEFTALADASMAAKDVMRVEATQ
ncbi:MAG: hypothetical protein C0498_01325 [Anaerolinea sp.]|nr:hypothetical protein [Anaerolinea sp.]